MRRSLCRRFVLVLIIFSATLPASAAEPVIAELEMEELAARVAAGEAAFTEYDLTLKAEYRDQRKPGAAGPGAGDIAAMKIDTTIHVVRQDGKLRCKRTARSVDANDEKRTMRFVQIFDGYETRTRWNDDAVRTVKGRQESEYAVSPHTFGYADWNCPLPLSAFIRAGYEESEERSPYVWTVDGTETVNGLKCVKATISYITSFDQPQFFRSTFYLCPERHYLPVRIISFRSAFSETLPHGEYEVTKWRELGPGVWCPVEFRTDVYELFALKENRIVRAYTRTERVTNISLKPRHLDEFFRLPTGGADPKTETPNR